MPRAMSNRIPKLSHHKADGRAVVRLNGRDIYCGVFGTDDAREAYDRLIAEWLANDRRLPDKDTGCELLVASLCTRFMVHAETYYKTDRKGSSEVTNFRDAIAHLTSLYKRTPVASFGVTQLRAVRESMISGGLARSTINARVNKIRKVFRWGVAEGLIDHPVHHTLEALPPLKPGRSDAYEPAPVGPVAVEAVNAVQKHLTPPTRHQKRTAEHPVWSMVRLQLATGMRPGEVVIMRGVDVTAMPDDDVWRYTPATHKTAHLGKTRVVFLVGDAAAIVRANLPTDLTAPVFPSRTGRAYTVNGYYQAVKKACRRAQVDSWCPLQLRHNFATRVREKLGIEAARVALGHARVETTEIYAEVTQGQALKVAKAMA